MSVYLITLLINICFLFLPNKKINVFRHKKKTDIATLGMIVVCIIMCILMAFRDYCVGIDTVAYQRSYIKIAEAGSLGSAINISTFTGPGYILICWLLHYISENPRLFVILSAIAINLMLYQYAKNKNGQGLKYILLWQTSYLFAFSFNGNRQVLATLLQLTGLTYIKENMKSIKGWILVALAVSVHPISMIVTIVYLLGNLLASKINYIQLMIVGMVSGVAVHFFLDFAVNIFLRFLPSYVKYFNKEVARGFYNNIGGGKIVYFYLFMLAVMIYFGISGRDKAEKYAEGKTELFTTILFCVLGILNRRNTTIFRITMFLMPFSISLISQMKNKTKVKYGNCIEISVHIVLIVYMLLNLIDNQSGVNPYIFDLGI